jgi:hypothetical protein
VAVAETHAVQLTPKIDGDSTMTSQVPPRPAHALAAGCPAPALTRSLKRLVSVAALAALALGAAVTGARGADEDFGLRVERMLHNDAHKLVGVRKPLAESARGPFAGPSIEALAVAPPLKVSLVSSAVQSQADMIALWPNDAAPTHLFVCVENFFAGNNPDVVSVQRVDLAAPAGTNAVTIVKGVSSCDPIRRTPWGTLVVGEESGSDGGLYEILDPLSIPESAPIVVTDRATGTSSDPTHLAKRKAVGSLSWEGNVILPDGTMYYGDESRPASGKAGGGVYKFVPATPFPAGGGPITSLGQSPFVAGTVYGLRVGSTATDWGQGSEIGQGVWMKIDTTVNPSFVDASGNIVLRTAQTTLGLTGYYRPEDMDRDPVAAAGGLVKVCWANTGRMTNGAGSAIEGGSNYGEVLCLWDQPSTSATSGARPLVERFVTGDPEANHFDNLAFQPHTGNLVVLEDGEVEVLNPDGSLRELRGNDIWMCLPDGADRDVLTDGCVRIASLRDTNSEPTGFVFDASGETAYVNLQHRVTGQGALLKISGFKVEE